MRRGVQATDTVLGTGDEAVRGKVSVINLRTFLPDGTELPEGFMPRSRLRIDLGRRDCIAGLRYGIEGMRADGRRTLVISPHLAYGDKGVPGKIPPNATLRCEVELLEVRERGVTNPEEYPPGRQLIVGWLGDLQHGVAKWQFGLHEDGRCDAMVWVPIPGLKWRHSRPKNVDTRLDPARAAALIDSAAAMQKTRLRDCLPDDRVYVDHSGHDGGIHRQWNTDTLCYAVTMYDRWQCQFRYFLAEDSQAWMTWELRTIIEALVAPVIEAGAHTSVKRGVLP